MKPFSLLLAGVLALASCRNLPFAILADGTKVSLGQSLVTKSTGEAHSATITSPTGIKITLKSMSTGNDETSAPGAFFGYKTTVGLGAQAAHSANVKEQQGTARAANARPGTVTTTTGPLGGSTQTVTPPPPAVVPGIGKGG